jgi:hypothetical protein
MRARCTGHLPDHLIATRPYRMLVLCLLFCILCLIFYTPLRKHHQKAYSLKNLRLVPGLNHYGVPGLSDYAHEKPLSYLLCKTVPQFRIGFHAFLKRTGLRELTSAYVIQTAMSIMSSRSWSRSSTAKIDIDVYFFIYTSKERGYVYVT